MPGTPAASLRPGALVVSNARALRSWWHPVAFSTEVGANPVACELLGEPLVLWRAAPGEPIRAAVDRCPHRWARLSAGQVDSGSLVCPYHGWRFGPDGAASLVPALGAGAPVPSRARLKVLDATDRYGLVWVCPNGPPRGDIPAIPELDDPEWRSIGAGRITYRCAAPAVIDNNLDATHVAFVHAASIGRGQDPSVGPGEVERTPFGLRQLGSNPVAGRPGAETATSRTASTEIWLPFVQVTRFSYPEGPRQVLVKACCPRRDDVTDVLLTVLRDDTESDVAAADVVAYERAIEAEDAAVLATLPVAFPLDVTAQIHLPQDRAGVLLRRLYAELLEL
jgi:phenylpropionate dioxygenase-like ring-hydroxylating dioxygenase large terminal subunit